MQGADVIYCLTGGNTHISLYLLTMLVVAAIVAAVSVVQPLNWFAGWAMVFAAFLTGAMIGLGFHREDFLGGYTSFRRRMLRLGHVALAALGMMNVVFALSPWPVAGTTAAWGASVCFLGGGISMPVICFLAAWRKPLRHLFILPVSMLIAAVMFTLAGGPT